MKSTKEEYAVYFHEPPRFTEMDRTARLLESVGGLDPLFENFISTWGVPGMAYGIIIDGQLLHASSVGFADVSTGAAPTKETVFRIASMTKSFTAMCILMLRDDGVLKLDDRAAHYLPELASLRYPTSDSPEITIRQLLSMSAGLVEDDPWGDRLLDLEPSAFSALLGHGVTFDLAPATAYEYSNLGFALLGGVVAHAAGESLKSFATRRIFEPLGMSSTTWDADGVPAGDGAIGYRRENGAWIVEPPLADGAFGAMGGIATSVVDLARYVALHLDAWPPRDGDETGPIRRSSLREMAQFHRAGNAFVVDEEPTDRRPAFDGYGFGLVSTVHRTYGRMTSHSGSLPGFSSHMEWLPECGVGVVALANRTYVPVKDVVRETIDRLGATGALLPREIPTSPALLRVQDAVTSLYETWDQSLAEATMLDTYFLDLDDDRKAPDLQTLRKEYGACISVSPITATGALRGSWRMECEGGVHVVTVMLGPILPNNVQFIKVKSARGA